MAEIPCWWERYEEKGQTVSSWQEGNGSSKPLISVLSSINWPLPTAGAGAFSDMWRQSTASFWTSAQAVTGQCNTFKGKRYPPSSTCTYRWPQLARVHVSDREKRVVRVFWTPGHKWLWQCWESNSISGWQAFLLDHWGAVNNLLSLQWW